ncbi:MAG: hypothetical protein HW380_2689 [Magnetococcales bacterium]|nr:hypothetical protein [Magnetococcales bacterium]
MMPCGKKNLVGCRLQTSTGGDDPPYALTLLLVKIFAGVRGGSSPPILTLILILLPPKGGLGAQPQGFDFVSLPEGHHV